MIAVVTAADAAEEHSREARSRRGVRQAGQELRVVVKVSDVQLFEPLRTQGGDAERDVLQVFLPLLRCHDDLFQHRRIFVLRHRLWRGNGQGRSQRSGGKHVPSSRGPQGLSDLQLSVGHCDLPCCSAADRRSACSCISQQARR